MDNSPKSLIAVVALTFVIAAVPLTVALGPLGILMAGVLVLIPLFRDEEIRLTNPDQETER